MKRINFLVDIFLMSLTILVSCVESNNKKIVEEPKEEYRNYNLIYVEGGEFVMGSEERDANAAHKVFVDDFYISDIEVTQEFYEKVIGYNPSYERYLGVNKPVNNVSWYDAIVFCNRLSEQEGLEPCYLVDGLDTVCNFNANGYRLPTEAEWEYAASGGKFSHGYIYSGSNNLDEVGWCWDLNELNNVALLDENELNIYDMSGNVEEWCWDFYDENYYNKSDYKNPKGPDINFIIKNYGLERIYKVLKGGSYAQPGMDCAVYTCSFIVPDGYWEHTGFRICKSKIDK